MNKVWIIWDEVKGRVLNVGESRERAMAGVHKGGVPLAVSTQWDELTMIVLTDGDLRKINAILGKVGHDPR